MDISKYIPRQVNIPYLGAMWTLSCACMTLVNGVSFVFQTRLFYYNQGDTLLKDIFGSYLIYAAVITLVGLVTLAFAYIMLLPSVNKFQQEQAVIDGRSPMFEKICEIDDRIKEIEKRL